MQFETPRGTGRESLESDPRRRAVAANSELSLGNSWLSPRVVALGAINSGTNLNNSGSTPGRILAGFNPGNASVFNAGVAQRIGRGPRSVLPRER